MNSCMLVAVPFHWRTGLKMNDRKPRKTASTMIVVTTVSTELKGLEKRFSFTHSRGGSFGISGGSANCTSEVPMTLRLSWSGWYSAIYRSTSFIRTLNQLTTTEMVSEQLR